MPTAGTLHGRRCAECGRLWLETRRQCPFCGSDGGEALELSGRGRLVSWTVIRVAPARYASEAPYAVALVALDEGVRLTARVDGDPDQLTAGGAVAFSSLDTLRGPMFRLR